MNRMDLTERLELLNQALGRMRSEVYVTIAESAALPLEDLRVVVAATARKVRTMARSL